MTREIESYYIVKVGALYLEKPWKLDYGLKLTTESNAYKFTKCEAGDSLEWVLSEVISKLDKQGFSDVKIIEKKVITEHVDSEMELVVIGNKLILHNKHIGGFIHGGLNMSQIDWDKIFTNTTSKGWSK